MAAHGKHRMDYKTVANTITLCETLNHQCSKSNRQDNPMNKCTNLGTVPVHALFGRRTVLSFWVWSAWTAWPWPVECSHPSTLWHWTWLFVWECSQREYRFARSWSKCCLLARIVQISWPQWRRLCAECPHTCDPKTNEGINFVTIGVSNRDYIVKDDSFVGQGDCHQVDAVSLQEDGFHSDDGRSLCHCPNSIPFGGVDAQRLVHAGHVNVGPDTC